MLHGALDLSADFSGTEFGPAQYTALMLDPPAQLCRYRAAREGENWCSADLRVSIGNAEGGYRRFNDAIGRCLPLDGHRAGFLLSILLRAHQFDDFVHPR